jgi:hypothetical protein
MVEFEFREVRKSVQFWLIPDGINGLLYSTKSLVTANQERDIVHLRHNGGHHKGKENN